jgi:MSHA biogenesis protein MshI
MRWPWTPRRTSGLLACSLLDDALVWVRAEGAPGHPGLVTACGWLEPAAAGVAADSSPATPERVQALRAAASGCAHALAVLPLQRSQLLQIEAPAVPSDEMRAAARWHVKDLVDGAVDDFTLDVMPIADGGTRNRAQVFVAAARNDAVRALADLAQAAALPLTVIDIAEAAQRNLQTAASSAAGLDERATAALVRHGNQWLLTVCLAGELHQARRLDAHAGTGAAAAQGTTPAAVTPATLAAATLAAAAASAASVAVTTAEASAAALSDDWEYIDYGADALPLDDTPATITPAAENAPAPSGSERLVLELQRSLDVWERSRPDLPLAQLWLFAGTDDESSALAAQLGRALGLRCAPLQPAQLLPGLDAAASHLSPAQRAALLPLLGALLRTEHISI